MKSPIGCSCIFYVSPVMDFSHVFQEIISCLSWFFRTHKLSINLIDPVKVYPLPLRSRWGSSPVVKESDLNQDAARSGE